MKRKTNFLKFNAVSDAQPLTVQSIKHSVCFCIIKRQMALFVINGVICAAFCVVFCLLAVTFDGRLFQLVFPFALGMVACTVEVVSCLCDRRKLLNNFFRWEAVVGNLDNPFFDRRNNKRGFVVRLVTNQGTHTIHTQAVFGNSETSLAFELFVNKKALFLFDGTTSKAYLLWTIES